MTSAVCRYLTTTSLARLLTLLLVVILLAEMVSFSFRPLVLGQSQTIAVLRQHEGVNTSQGTWWRDFLCGPADQRPQGSQDDHHLVLQQLFKDVVPGRRDANVFLMDTACNTHPRYRAWCAVESWARQNPSLDVWFVMTAEEVDDSDRLPSLLLHHYPNLRLVGVDLNHMFRDTPVQPLFMSRRWTVVETWPAEVLSNMLRALVLWHWGGVYSDTDIISIKPFAVPLNATGFDAKALIGSALYAFSSRHPVLWSLMEDINREFKVGVWGIVGPDAITRVMKRECGTEDMMALLRKAPVSCANVTIYPDNYFFPLHWLQFQQYFDDVTGRNFSKNFESSFMLHVWNKFTKVTPMKVGWQSIYDVAAKTFCPLTYARASLRSNYF